jgi:hypothetical protein
VTEPEKRDDQHTSHEPYIHPEHLPKPEHLKASLDDVVNLFEHGGTEEDEPDIQSDTPAP